MRALAMLSAVVLTVLTLSVHAAEKMPYMPLVAGPAAEPVGWDEFCANTPNECAPSMGPGFVTLTVDKLRELRIINTSVNSRYLPLINRGGMDFPKDGAANCVGYARQKRLELMARGWPAEALLLTNTKSLYERSTDHMVLTVRTNKGDFILDNATHRGEVVLWSKTRYRYISRQAGTKEGWVKIHDPYPHARQKTALSTN